ncbi:MAG: hypothetical protein KAS32_01735 [Candidatus Peribacteraceae bacterium]|nr:hypothetical protein [Candidatus Peribacteraceae bacterium]
MIMSFDGIKIQSIKEFEVCHQVVIKKNQIVELYKVDLSTQKIMVKVHDNSFFGWTEPEDFIMLEDVEIIMAMLDTKHSC